MGRRNSKAKPRSRRNPSPRDASDDHLLESSLEAAIEAERSRLWQVSAVLECLGLALTYSDAHDCHRTDLSDATAVANRLVGETIDQLDSVNIGPLIRKAARTTVRPRRNP